MALVTVDGGDGYWNPHPGDDPLTMIVDELIPRCQTMNLGRSPSRIGTMGISMGGYGALLVAEKHPGLIAAVAAISPAVWTSYPQASAANDRAYASASDFAADDVVTHTSTLVGKPVRIASGLDDPFHPGVVTLGQALPPGAIVDISKGCHTEISSWPKSHHRSISLRSTSEGPFGSLRKVGGIGRSRARERRAKSRSVRPRIAELRPAVSLQGASKRLARVRRWSSNSNGDKTSNSAAALPRTSVGQSNESDVMVNRHRPGPTSSRVPHGPTRPRMTAVGASMNTST